VGLWDTFRAACPLLVLLRSDVMNDYIKTFLAHYKHLGQLPIWTLAGNETFQMIGIHSIPVIADCFAEGVQDFD